MGVPIPSAPPTADALEPGVLAQRCSSLITDNQSIINPASQPTGAAHASDRRKLPLVAASTVFNQKSSNNNNNHAGQGPTAEPVTVTVAASVDTSRNVNHHTSRSRLIPIQPCWRTTAAARLM